jgi:hypothetical protein
MGVEFDGIDDFILINNNANIDITGDISISLWIHIGSFGTFPGILYKAKNPPDTGGQFVQYGFFLDNPTNRVVGIFGNGTVSERLFTGVLTINTWYHLVLTRNGTNVKLYLDGSEVDNGTLTGNLFTNNYDIHIGHDIRYLGTRYFDGLVNEVAIWDTFLTDAEAKQLFNPKIKGMPLQNKSSNLQAYWSLDDFAEGTSGDGLSYVDFSGNSNTGTGDDGANNTGLTNKAEEVLSYSTHFITPGIQTFIPFPLFKGMNAGIGNHNQGGIAA